MEEAIIPVINGNDILAQRSAGTIDQVVGRAVTRAGEMHAQVKFEFNGVTVTVAADSNEDRINDTFLLAPRAGIKEIGPYPPDVEEFDDTKAKPYVLHDHGRRDTHIIVTAYQLNELGWGRTRGIDKPDGFVAWMGTPGTWYVKLQETGATFLLRNTWGDPFQVCDCSA